MKRLFLLTMAVMLFCLCGCSVLDRLAGLNPETGEMEGPTIAEQVRPLAPLVGPWGSIAVEGLGALALLYGCFRGKKYKEAGVSLARGSEELLKALEDKGVSRDEALAILKAIQNKDGTRGTIAKLIESL